MPQEFDLSLLKEKSFSFSTEIPVFIQHINYGNHVGHDSLISLLHEARVQFLKNYQLSETSQEEIGLIMTDLSIQYKSEAFYGDILQFDIDFSLSGQVRCNFLYRVKEKSSQKIIALAVTHMAFYDYQRKKLAKTPEAFIQAFL